MEILKQTWFTNLKGCIGVVQVKNDYGEIKSYISVVEGVDQDADAKFVAEWGNALPNEFWENI